MAHEDLLGLELEPYEMRVEHGKVVEFATAVLADDPVHVDIAAASAAGYDDVVATPTFSAASSHWAPRDRARNPMGLDFRRVLAGGNEWEYHRPVVAGDVLTVAGKVVDVQHKAGRRGGMTMIVLENTFRDPSGEVVLVNRSTIMELDAAPAESEERA